MRRTERRLLAINDELAALQDELYLTREEWIIHQHLNDDAQRDAVVGGPIARDDARVTGSDVARFERVTKHLEDRIAALERKRAKLLAKLEKK